MTIHVEGDSRFRSARRAVSVRRRGTEVWHSMLSPPGGPRSNQPSGPRSECATSQMCDPQRSGPAAPEEASGLRAARVAPLPRALRPGPCPSPAHTQRCNFAIASRFRDPTPGGASRRRARRGFPSSRVMAHAVMAHRRTIACARCFGVFSTARLHMTPWNTARAYMASPHFRTGPRSTCAGTLEYARRGRHGERPEGR